MSRRKNRERAQMRFLFDSRGNVRDDFNQSHRNSPIGSEIRRAREELVSGSQGLFNVPEAWSLPFDGTANLQEPQMCCPPSTLPDPALVSRLIHGFQMGAFRISPYHEVDEFVELSNRIYASATRGNEGPEISPAHPKSWLVGFFASLALTAHCMSDDKEVAAHYHDRPQTAVGWDLAYSAQWFFTPMSRKRTVDDVRGSLALSIYYRRLNHMDSARIWLSVSREIALQLGTYILFQHLIEQDMNASP
jgi:hypothetical protein